MGLTLLTERYAPQIAGVLSCWVRILLFSTLPKVCYAEGMTSYLYERKIRIFDYPKFAEPFRNRLRENADRVKAVLDKRGEPGSWILRAVMSLRQGGDRRRGDSHLLANLPCGPTLLVQLASRFRSTISDGRPPIRTARGAFARPASHGRDPG